MQSPPHARLPQKSTGSASKADELQWVRRAKAYMEMAHSVTPIYSEILRAIDMAIKGESYQSLEARTEKLLARLEQQPGQAAQPIVSTRVETAPVAKGTVLGNPAHKPSVTTYASVMKTGAKTPVAAKSSAGASKKSLKPSQRLVSNERNTQSKMPTQVVLLTKKNATLPPYSSMAIRNAINSRIARGGEVKGPVIGSVATSKNGNIVLTTIQPYDAEFLKAHQPQWQEAVKNLPIEDCQIQRPWLKLVAHGVSTEVGDDFGDECEVYNPVQVKGAVRWLKKPSKPTGSMVFAVATEREQTYCLNKGLLIAGKRVKVVKFKTHSQYSQCFRCQGFGHDPAKCKKRVACKLCAGHHLTKTHKCAECKASTQCQHTHLKCVNCGGRHAANSLSCEILKAVRGPPPSDEHGAGETGCKPIEWGKLMGILQPKEKEPVNHWE